MRACSASLSIKGFEAASELELELGPSHRSNGSLCVGRGTCRGIWRAEAPLRARAAVKPMRLEGAIAE
jgi:hypothetical protein